MFQKIIEVVDNYKLALIKTNKIHNEIIGKFLLKKLNPYLKKINLEFWHKEMGIRSS